MTGSGFFARHGPDTPVRWNERESVPLEPASVEPEDLKADLERIRKHVNAGKWPHVVRLIGHGDPADTFALGVTTGVPERPVTWRLPAARARALVEAGMLRVTGARQVYAADNSPVTVPTGLSLTGKSLEK